MGSRLHGIKDTQMGRQDPWQIDIDGVVAEMVYGKQFNLCPDLTGARREDGADFITHDGKTVDVKSTRLTEGRLLATLKKAQDPCYFYALVIVDDWGGWYVGSMLGARLLAEDNKIDLGHGTTYGVEQYRLVRRD